MNPLLIWLMKQSSVTIFYWLIRKALQIHAH